LVGEGRASALTVLAELLTDSGPEELLAALLIDPAVAVGVPFTARGGGDDALVSVRGEPTSLHAHTHTHAYTHAQRGIQVG